MTTVHQIWGDLFVLQQDNVPAHHAHDTIEFVQQETSAFISPEFWPQNIADLTAVDYKICARMQHFMYHSKF